MYVAAIASESILDSDDKAVEKDRQGCDEGTAERSNKAARQWKSASARGRRTPGRSSDSPKRVRSAGLRGKPSRRRLHVDRTNASDLAGRSGLAERNGLWMLRVTALGNRRVWLVATQRSRLLIDPDARPTAMATTSDGATHLSATTHRRGLFSVSRRGLHLPRARGAFRACLATPAR